MTSTIFSPLAHSIKGAIYLPGEAAYIEEIACFNAAIVHSPDAVAAVRSEDDIVEVIRFAKKNGFDASVQATGHGAVNAMTKGILISTKRMNRVAIDPHGSMATIGAGTRWKQVVEAASEYGLIPITGSSVDVGVVGYLLGGGVGPLARSHGFSSDYLIGLKVVTPAGDLLSASEAENSDLFWALRGGKIGVGIVTEVVIRLLKADNLYGGSLFFEEKDIKKALKGWPEWTKTSHDKVTTSIAIVNFPPLPFIPEVFRGRRLLSLRFAYPGSKEEGIELAKPLRALAPVYVDGLDEMAAKNIGLIHNDPSHSIPFWASSVLLDSIDDKLLTAVLDQFDVNQETMFTALEIRHIGAATKIDVPAGSSVGGRSAEYVVSLVGKGPLEKASVFAVEADRILTASPSISAEGNINLMGSALPGKHFRSLWPEAISQRLEAIRSRWG